MGNTSKDRHRFVDAIVLIHAPDWSNGLLNSENVVVTQIEIKSAFKHRMMLDFAKANTLFPTIRCRVYQVI